MIIIPHLAYTKIRKSTYFEGFALSSANQICLLIDSVLNVFINDRFDVRIVLFFEIDFIIAVLPKGTLVISYPFIVHSTFVVPAIVGRWESVLFWVKIRNSLFDNLVRGVLKSCFEGKTSSCFSSTYQNCYSLAVKLCPSRREDMKGSCETSFWLKF